MAMLGEELSWETVDEIDLRIHELYLRPGTRQEG
jgi:hypothetical protein